MGTDDRRQQFHFLLHGRINDKFMQELIDVGYLTCPASTKYHGAYEGGLHDHCKEVTHELVRMTTDLGLKWQREESPYIIGMLHDVCKLDNYKKVGHIASAGSGIASDISYSYEYSNQSLLTGHGEKSVMLIQQHMNLTEEEMLCIRYHMGAYIKEDWDCFDRSIRTYPNVLYTHVADMAASKIRGV